MFQFYDITDSQRHELNIWANAVIEANKEAMSSGKAYLLWSDWLYYQLGKDTWVDESWWIETAAKLFVEHKYDYDEKGTQVISALEILVHHFPAQYRDYARYKIDLWFNESYHDPEYWWDLIVAAIPDHPATKLLFEYKDSAYETRIAIKLGDQKTIFDTRENLIEDLEEGQICWVILDLEVFNKSIFDEVFSQSEADIIKSEILRIAEQELPVDNKDWYDQHAILKTSIIMQWQEIVEILSGNINYGSSLLSMLIYAQIDS